MLSVGLPDYHISPSYHVKEGERYESFRKSTLEKPYELPEKDFAYTLKDAGVEMTDYRYVQAHRRRTRFRRPSD